MHSIFRLKMLPNFRWRSILSVGVKKLVKINQPTRTSAFKNIPVDQTLVLCWSFSIFFSSRYSWENSVYLSRNHLQVKLCVRKGKSLMHAFTCSLLQLDWTVNLASALPWLYTHAVSILLADSRTLACAAKKILVVFKLTGNILWLVPYRITILLCTDSWTPHIQPFCPVVF